jgi:hypothetical protein
VKELSRGKQERKADRKAGFCHAEPQSLKHERGEIRKREKQYDSDSFSAVSWFS